MAEPVSGIGKCVAVYGLSGSGYVKLGAIMVVCSAIGGGMIWVGVAGGDSNTGGRIVLTILGLLFLLPVALGAHGLTRGRKNGVRIHDNGVVVYRSGEAFEVPFHAIDAYSDGAYLAITTPQNDEPITVGLEDLANVDDLFRRLREEVVVKRRVPRVLKELAAGKVAEFRSEGEGSIPETANDVGGYALDADGVTLAAPQRRIAWHEIVDYGSTSRLLPGPGKPERTATSVFLKTQTETFEAAIAPLSERELLLALCKEMKAARSPS
jgi:hypothetical protein